MAAENILLLCSAVGTLTMFGGVRAWASWMKTREEMQRTLTANAQANPKEKSE